MWKFKYLNISGLKLRKPFDKMSTTLVNRSPTSPMQEFLYHSQIEQNKLIGPGDNK